LGLLKEIASRYAVDGIVLDRIRYSGPNTDFSDLSRKLYEEYVGHPVSRFPDDLAVIPVLPKAECGGQETSGMWQQFRAEQIRSFVAQARKELKSIRPNLIFGAYVGASYDTYAAFGANWGAKGSVPRDKALPESYGVTGFAQELDVLFTGCYYENSGTAKYETRGGVEEAAMRSLEATQGQTRVIAGINAALFKSNAPNLARAIAAGLEKTSGVMVFDLSHIEKNGFWKDLRLLAPPDR
jgi:hypothetical protein